MNEKFIDSPRSCRNSANHLSNTRVSPPLPFLSGSCRNSANNITAMKLSYVSPCGMILLNLPLSFRQVETLQLEETKQAFFFFLFSRETRRWRDCFLCLLLGLRNGNTFTRFSALAFHLFPSCIFFFFLTIVIRVHRYSKSIQFFVRRDEKCFFKRRVETSSSRDSIIRF